MPSSLRQHLEIFTAKFSNLLVCNSPAGDIDWQARSACNLRVGEHDAQRRSSNLNSLIEFSMKNEVKNIFRDSTYMSHQ